MDTPSNIVVIEERKRQAVAAPVATDAPNPMQMLQIAVSQGADLEKLKTLMDLQDRWERNEARKAFITAMTAFKANPPEIMKNKHVSFETSRGVTQYDHATLAAVCRAIIAGLSIHGLSHTWRTEQSDGKIKVTCIITHALGHSEQTSMVSDADGSGGKNSIQGIGSTVTYLQRYTLLALTGLATTDREDTDGREPAEALPTITDEQVATLDAMLGEISQTAKASYLRRNNIKALGEILATNYDAAYQIIDRKRSEVK
jgi:hypothetical protein